jgi:cathepsin L
LLFFLTRAQGPLAINVEAITWGAYETGVFDGCNQTNPDIDHVVQLVGYGNDEKLGRF